MLGNNSLKISAFVSEEEYAQNLKVLTDILKRSTGNVRKKICDIYGFKLQLDGDDYLISHDGQRIGAGQVVVDGTRVHFEVYPKNTGIKLDELFGVYGDGLSKKYGKIHHFGRTSIEDKPDEFSFTFLLGLLHEIANFGTHFFNIYSTRKRIASKGKPIGRVVPDSFVMNQLKGKYDLFECETLDNSTLRLFATVFYHTAASVLKELQSLSIDEALSGANAQMLGQRSMSRLKPYVVDGFSRQMLNKISKPPYPFGVKELFFKCYKYWESKGSISAVHSKNEMAFSGFSVRLSDLFEDYVGIVFKKAYEYKYEYIAKRRFHYFKDESQERRLEPDHMFVNVKSKELVVVEVKYSNAVAIREHVSQLISYLDYKYEGLGTHKPRGILVYPGSTFTCTRLDSFKHNICIVTLSSFLNDSCLSIEREPLLF
ncbi:hypothetical protein RJ44_19880 [Alteromonas macleodii]|nr:hypothetical protein RJ44_19880 [Alteromonas macleodii]